MPPVTASQLAALVRQYVDADRLLAEHPEVSRAQLEAFWRRIGAEPPSERRQAPPADPPRRQRAGEHLVVVARCDGAARGNPGPAAIGVLLEDQEGQDLLDLAERIGETTCNVAEYRAVVRAAEKALQLGVTELELRLDSELIVRQLQGQYRVRTPHLRPLHRQALDLLGRFRRWDVAYVPRAENAAADRLANQALDGR